MKKSLIHFLLVAFHFSFSANDSTLTFSDKGFEGIFEQAANEEKNVMLYFHFDGCGGCVKMEKTAFLDPNVKQYYEKNFVLHEVNTQKGAGIQTNQIYNVQTHPTFLFLNSQGEVIHKVVGVFTPSDFQQEAQKAILQKRTYPQLKSQYESGNREVEFLYDYCYAMENAFENKAEYIQEYFKVLPSDSLSSPRNIRFIYQFMLHSVNITTPFDSPAFQYMLNHPEDFEVYFEKDQIATRLVRVLYATAYEAVEAKDEARLDEVMELMRPYDTGQDYIFKEMDGRATGLLRVPNMEWGLKMMYHEKMGEVEKYKAAEKIYTEKIWDNAKGLDEVAWRRAKQTNDMEKLEIARSWSERSIELQPTSSHVHTLAFILFKMKDLESAKTQAERALMLAEEEGKDSSKIKILLGKIAKEDRP